MQIIEVIIDFLGSTVLAITRKDSSKKITKIGWIVIFLFVLALFLFTWLNS